MKEKKNVTKLYNVIFPFWMLVLFPYFWLIIFPANFIIDSLVLIAAMFVLKIEGKKMWYKKHIVKIFSFGMLSDFIGALYMLLIMLLFENFGLAIDDLRLTLPALVISAVLIFVLNYFITFRKSEKIIRQKMSLIFAIVTAPYTFLIPISWMY